MQRGDTRRWSIVRRHPVMISSFFSRRSTSALERLQARPGGICPVREQLFSELFDELIRQVTIECPERGLMLLRTRDQLRMTLMCYLTLHRSSCDLGVSKSVHAESCVRELEDNRQVLELQTQVLKTRVVELEHAIVLAEKQARDEQAWKAGFIHEIDELRQQAKSPADESPPYRGTTGSPGV